MGPCACFKTAGLHPWRPAGFEHHVRWGRRSTVPDNDRTPPSIFHKKQNRVGHCRRGQPARGPAPKRGRHRSLGKCIRETWWPAAQGSLSTVMKFRCSDARFPGHRGPGPEGPGPLAPRLGREKTAHTFDGARASGAMGPIAVFGLTRSF